MHRLRDFTDQYNITIPLLSDEDSAVIRRYGILNTLIESHEGRSMNWYGIPYPGTYIADASGVIIDKIFEQHHARRPSGSTLLHRLTGRVHDVVPGVTEEVESASGPEVTLRVRLSDPTLRLEVISTLVCELQIAAGQHVYAPGAPEAFTPAEITVAGDGIRSGPPSWPSAGPGPAASPRPGSGDGERVGSTSTRRGLRYDLAKGRPHPSNNDNLSFVKT